MFRTIKKLWRQYFAPDVKKSSTATSHAVSTVRLGSEYGGWHIPADLCLSSTDVCFLAGAGEDLSFDCALAMRFPCPIHIFDPTPRAVAHFEGLAAAVAAGGIFAPLSGTGGEPYNISAEAFSRMTFHPWGLAAQDKEMRFYAPTNPEHVSHSILNLQKTTEFFIAPVKRVPSILKELGYTQITLMKLDIEGAEYQVIEDMIAMKMLPKIMLVEFDEIHNPLDSGAHDRVARYMEMLKYAGMRHVFTDVANMTFIQH